MTTKLLAVDDSKTMRRVLEITFGGEDFKTTICGSSAEALQAIRAERPEVALVDASLAGESGYELCRQIKAEAPDVRVLILSSKHRPYDERQGSGASADGSFDKPFDSTKIIEKIKSMLGAAPVVAPAPAAPARPAAAPLAPTSRGPAPAVSRPVLGSPSARPAVPAQAAMPAQTAAPAQGSVAPRPAPTGIPRPATSESKAAPAPSPAGQSRPGGAASPLEKAAPAIAAGAALSSPQFSDKLKQLGLSAAQVEGVLSLSRDVVEQVVWEVVPALAETLIKEEIARLTAG